MKNLDEAINSNSLDDSFSNVSGRFMKSTTNGKDIDYLKREISQIQTYITNATNSLNLLNSGLTDAKNERSVAKFNSENMQIGWEDRDNYTLRLGVLDSVIIPDLTSKITAIKNDIDGKNNLIKAKREQISSLSSLKSKGLLNKPSAINKFEPEISDTSTTTAEDIANQIKDIKQNATDSDSVIDQRTQESTYKISSTGSIFTLKNAAIVVVILGLTIGILKYKKVIFKK